MKHALITGASEGIGRAFAQKLATQGYAVTAIARNEKRLQELMQELGGGHSYLPADLSKTEDTARIVKTLTTKKFDLLVNNAGIGVYGTFNEAEALQIDAMMEINCHSLMSLSSLLANGDKRRCADQCLFHRFILTDAGDQRLWCFEGFLHGAYGKSLVRRTFERCLRDGSLPRHDRIQISSACGRT